MREKEREKERERERESVKKMKKKRYIKRNETLKRQSPRLKWHSKSERGRE